MSTTIGSLLIQHPTNTVIDPAFETPTRKKWAEGYSAIKNMKVYTWIVDDVTHARFDGPFFPEYDDDQVRKNIQAYPPNTRIWRLETETDIANYFHHEVSNIVLAGWAEYPWILHASEAAPLNDQPTNEKVDQSYSTAYQGDRKELVIGEMKRNTIREGEWQNGKLISIDQKRLSQELRGYADRYECPQVFCFDGATLLVLQFRASELKYITDAQCPVDVWVIPRDNEGGTTLRYAFYRLLTQGFRRFQSIFTYNPKVWASPADRREFFSGKPVWADDNLDPEKVGYLRVVDATHGAFFWRYQNKDFAAENGGKLWDTYSLWNATGNN